MNFLARRTNLTMWKALVVILIALNLIILKLTLDKIPRTTSHSDDLIKIIKNNSQIENQSVANIIHIVSENGTKVDICGDSSLIKASHPIHQIFNPTQINQEAVDFSSTPAVRSRLRKSRPAPEPRPDSAPSVSVIVTCTNSECAGKFNTLESLFAQTFINFEVILVTDNHEAKALLKAAFKDERLKTLDVDSSKTTVWNGRNLGSAKARGKFLMFLDSGDMLEPTALEKFVFFLETRGTEWAWVSSFGVMLNHGTSHKPQLWKHGYQTIQSHLRLFEGGEILLIPRALHRKSGGFKEGPVKGGAFSHWEYVLRLASHGHWGFSLPEYLIWSHQCTFKTKKLLEYASNSLKKSYPRLWTKDGFPPQKKSYDIVKNPAYTYMPLQKLPLPADVKGVSVPRRQKKAPSVLFIIEDMKQNDAILSTNLLVVRDLVVTFRWEVAVVITEIHSRKSREDGLWLGEKHMDLCGDQGQFQSFTPEVYCLNAFLHPEDYGLFLSKLVKSRQMDVVMISGKSGYQILPWLKRCHPKLLFVDILDDKELPSGRMAATYSAHFNAFLDLTLTPSEIIKEWLATFGVPESKISVFNVATNMVLCESTEGTSIAPETEDFLLKEHGVKQEDHLVIIVSNSFAGELVFRFALALIGKFFAKVVKKQASDWKLAVLGDGSRLRSYYQLTQGFDSSKLIFIDDWSGFPLSELLQRASSIVLPPTFDEAPLRSLGGLAVEIWISIALTFSTPFLHHSQSIMTSSDMFPDEYFYRILEKAHGEDLAPTMADFYLSRLEWILNDMNDAKAQAQFAKEFVCQNKETKQGNVKEALCKTKEVMQGSVVSDDKIQKEILNWQVFPIIEYLRLLHEVQK